MGTISEKLVYLNGTKQAIKQAINEDFEVIDNNTTFREYADEISSNNAKYKDLIPKETKNATNTLDISNSAGLDKALVTQYGNTIQEGEPTPDYPQEIQVVTGDNSIKVVGKNFFNYNVITNSSNYTNNYDGTFTRNSNGTNILINVDNASVPYDTFSLKNGTYSVSFDIKTTVATRLSNFFMCTKQSGETANLSKAINIEIPANTTVHIKAENYNIVNDAEKVGFAGYLSVSTGITISNIQVEAGSTATTYAPYQSQSFDLDLKSRNLFDISTITENTYIDERGYTGSSRVSNLSDYIELKPNASYTLSYDYSTLLNSTQRDFVYYDENKTNISGLTYSPINKTRTFTTPNNAKYLRFSYDKNCNSIMLNEGSTIQAYEPFYDINLCKIGDYKDRIYPLNGKWYLEKKIGKVVLTNSSGWSKINGTTVNTYNAGLGGKANRTNANSPYLSNYFSPIATDNRYQDKTFFINAGNRVVVSYDEKATVSDFTSWLSTHNTIVYYVLATPTTEEITENNYPTLYNQLNNIKLFEGVNHITMTNESGLDVEFDITYYKDWKLD